VFALAAVHLPRADAQQAVAAALGRTQMPELKFAALARSNSGRRNILALLADAALTPENAAVGAAHKPWLLAAKLVDELIEPTMLARGLQVPWYASGDHLTMVGILYKPAWEISTTSLSGPSLSWYVTTPHRRRGSSSGFSGAAASSPATLRSTLSWD
jgi:hypothetical protein